jgi:protein-disulfide isomerase
MTTNKIPAFIGFVLIAYAVTLAQSSAPQKSTPIAPARSGAATQPKTAPAGSPGQAKTSLPTNEEVETALKRSFGYDPALTWQVLDIRPSVFPGFAEVLVAINKQPPVHLYLVPGIQTAIVGQTIPFGANPFAADRAKLQGAFGPSRGSQNPSIDIVEFSDLQCPHCKVAQPIVEKLGADFPLARFTFQQFPLPASLHPWALKAAQYADCAGQMNKDVFWKYVDAIFENQGGIALATADDKLKELATANGLDAQKIAACAASPETDARIKKSQALGATLEVNETPTVFINGRRVPGIASIPYDQLKQLVQFEIDHAGK